MIARAVSTRPKIAVEVDILISQFKASSNPPPKAAPSMQAIVGIGKC